MEKEMWDAYAKQAGGITFDGKPLPTWDELGEERQACWKAAASVCADEIERLREQAHYHYENGLKKDVEIERLREVNITQAKWLYDEQQAHKTLRNKVRQWLRDDKFDILKENE